jgi:uroporphyrinogen-III synthase
MKSKVVAILETRTGAHLGELIARRGGIPLLAPALEEVPDVDPRAVASLIERWRIDPFKIVIFQTGVGTRALFQATDSAGLTAELLQYLRSTTVVVRGPKPVGELNARGVRIDIRAATPFTTETVLGALSGLALLGARVLVQRYGASNQQLRESLERRGACVEEIATYRWALPADTQPLEALLTALSRSGVDAVVFTSAVQIHNLYAVAEKSGRASELAGHLNRLFVASIGPVCSRALREHGVTPSFEADPPKLGPLVAGLDQALSADPTSNRPVSLSGEPG